MFGSPVIRAAVISALICGVAAVLMLEFGPANAIGLMRLKVVNNTNRTVRVQPCWDLNCHDTLGLRDSIVRPGQRANVSSEWADDVVESISIAVLKPAASVPNFEGCLVNTFMPHVKVGVFYVSTETTCPVSSGGGGGGF